MKDSNAAAERAAAQRALKNGDLKDRDTYTAKQVAARCGTDSKTMRKFFRSAHSTVEPVGQGGRYEFDAADFPKIKREFDAWQKRSKSSRTPIHSEAAKSLQQKFKDEKELKRARKSEQGDPPPKNEKDPTGAVVSQEVDAPHEFDNEWDPDKWGTPYANGVGPEDPSDEELAELESLELDLDDLDAEDD